MELVALLLASLALGGALVLGLRRLDRSRLDPAGTVFLWVFPWVGVGSLVPGFALYALADALGNGAPGLWGRVVFTWTVNAPAEELAKYLSFVVATRLLASLREPRDGVLQGAAVGLGFGLAENVLYGLADGWVTFVVRSVLSLPGHMVYGAVWGGYHGFEVYQGAGRMNRPWVPLLALIPAAFSHALFNTLSLLGAPLVATLAVDALTLGLGVFLYRRLSASAPRLRPLRQWRQAIPELEHALTLHPRSETLRRFLSAYYLASKQPQKAHEVLGPLSDTPWTRFYHDAAQGQLGTSSPTAEASARLSPRLFAALSSP